MCGAGLPDGIDTDIALIVLIINIIAPGVGTLIASCLGTKCLGSTVAVGILQILTTPLLLFGWIWAIIWSVLLYKKAKDKAELPTTAAQAQPAPAPAPVAPPPPAAGQPPYTSPPPPAQPQPPYGAVPNTPPQYVGAPPPPAPQK